MALTGKEKMAALRAKMAAEEKKTSVISDNASYAFWNLSDDPKKGNTAIVRFLPDKDDSNDFFWRIREVINIPFCGILGEDEDKQVEVQVPCLDMWADTKGKDPIINATKSWWKTDREDEARKYWKKRSYIFQGFVVESAFHEENPPENPIRRFLINPSIFKIIKGSLMDPEMENLPTDYDHGCDLRLIKTSKSTPQGMQADYTTSSWSRRERALSSKELAAIEEYGLFDLKEYLPKKPSDEQIVAIKEMFYASIKGELYDPSRWGNLYKPFGYSSNTPATDVDSNLKIIKANIKPVTNDDDDTPPISSALNRMKSQVSDDDDDDTDDEPKLSSKPKKEMSDILAMVNKRQTK